ncbi:MAG: hypothetical protein CMM93_05585 [Rickettsiales bacterium]|nr:hypothetical protein [Rickettsiales bacterium]
MRHGFSLVELSIVLVILGLLTGGILTGQSLIRAAELRGVVTELQRFQTATRSFQDKYFAIPGDMRNATDFWGVAHATPTTCATTASTDAKTCNGDGDGIIEHTVLNATSNEQFRFWQHLANAGLIEGNYTGIAGSTGNHDHVIFGTNTPKSKLSNAGWSVRYWSSIQFVRLEHAFNLGAASTASTNNGAILKAEEMWSVDTKMDDGKPATGKIRPNDITHPNCVTNTTSTAAYQLSDSNTACALLFLAVK